MVIRAIAVAALLLTLVLLSAEAAMACSCLPIDPKKKLAGSKGAVTARLLEVGEEDFVYRTGRVVKGEARGLQRGRRLVVRSQLPGTSCGLEGEPGGLTGLFLDRENGRWTSFSCNQVSRAAMLGLTTRSVLSNGCAGGG